MKPSRLIRSIVAATSLVSFALPGMAFAAEPTHDALIGAHVEGKRLGVCSSEKQNFGDDCVRTKNTCESARWIEQMSFRYELAGPLVVAKQGVTGPFEGIEYLRANPASFLKATPEPYYQGTCYCGCPEGATFEACKGKPAGTPFRAAEDLTYEQCVSKCKPNAIATKCAGALPPVAPQAVAASKGLGTQAGVTQEDSTCFRPDECNAQHGIFESYATCGSGKGRCYAEEPTLVLNVPIGGVTEVKGFNNYVIAAYRYMISIGAIVATIAFVWGAFLYLLGSAVPSISKGRAYMADAIMGLLLILGANLILRTINPATTRLNPIKVPMVNMVQFVNSTFCKDLGAVKLAAAGVKPKITPYDEVAKDPKNFKTTPVNSLCGTDYWVQDATGSTCEGQRCEQPDEACVSCADANLPGCVGVASDKRVCGNAVFAGTIDYIDKKYPSEVTLVAFCNHAQSTTASDVDDSLFGYRPTNPQKVGRTTTQGKTDSDEVGRAAYSMKVTPLDIAKAIQDCKSYGGLRGFVLGVDINENFGISDSAVLSKKNCSGGRFDGYANGGGATDIDDYADAIACGVKNGKFLDDPNKTNFWTKEQLDSAVKGSPITCNFTLSNENAPDDPSSKFCGAGGGAEPPAPGADIFAI